MDERTLLCERCGYTLEGLSPAGACPECGSMVASSLPATRPGSAWQTGPSIRAWVVTNIRALRRPGAQFRAGAATVRGSRSLLLINCFIAGLLTVLPWTGTLIGDPSRGRSGVVGMLLVLAMVPVQAALVGAVMLALTAVEHAGIRFFSARRGWRLSRGAAWMVCAHASVGWLMGPALAFLGLALYFGVERVFGVAAHGTVRLSLGRAIDLGSHGWDHLVQIAIIVGSFTAGLVWFEMLVYVGVRQSRFANAPRPGEAAIGPAPVAV